MPTHSQNTAINFSEVKWSDKDDVSAFVSEAVRAKERYNLHFERQSELNIAWYRGHQTLYWSNRMRELRPIDNPEHRLRITANIIGPLVNGWLAKIALDRVRHVSRPKTDDLSDHKSAQLGSSVLRYYADRLNYENAFTHATDQWCALSGEAFGKVVWDPTAGPEVQMGEADLSALPEEEQNRARRRRPRIGDLVVAPVSSLNLYWGPPGLSFEQADWVLELYDRSVPYVMQRYGLSRDEAVEAQKQQETNALRVWRPLDTHAGGVNEFGEDPEVITVAVLWCRKNAAIRGLERGRHVVKIGENVVKNGPIPYRHGRVPIIRWPFLEIPGQSRAQTPVTDILPLQADLNRNISQRAENRELMANPVWLAQEGAIVDLQQWHDRPGGIRTYRGTRPELQRGEVMPDSTLGELSLEQRFAQDLIGIRDVSQAKNPPNVRSGRAILALQEADNERLGPIALSRRKFHAEIGLLMIQTVWQFATEERLIRIFGDEDRSRVVRFRGDLLGGRDHGPEDFDVTVETTGFKQSPAAQMENVVSLAQQRFLNPDKSEHERLVMKVMGFDKPPLYGIDRKEMTRDVQHRRNEIILAGGFEPPREWEDHETLLEELNAFRTKLISRPGISVPQEVLDNFQRYEESVIELMAIRQPRLQAIVQRALVAFDQGAGGLLSRMSSLRSESGSTEAEEFQPAPGGNGQNMDLTENA